MIADLFGISYEEISIWLFVIIGPILFFISIYFNYYFYKKTKKLNKIIELKSTKFSKTDEVKIELKI